MRISDWSSDVCSSDLRQIADAAGDRVFDFVIGIAGSVTGQREILTRQRVADRRLAAVRDLMIPALRLVGADRAVKSILEFRNELRAEQADRQARLVTGAARAQPCTPTL